MILIQDTWSEEAGVKIFWAEVGGVHDWLRKIFVLWVAVKSVLLAVASVSHLGSPS